VGIVPCVRSVAVGYLIIGGGVGFHHLAELSLGVGVKFFAGGHHVSEVVVHHWYNITEKGSVVKGEVTHRLLPAKKFSLAE